MAGFSFRIRLAKAKSSVVDAGAATALVLPIGAGLPDLELSSGSDDTPLGDADAFYVVSDGWPDREAASHAGHKHVGLLLRVFARMRIGVDFGARRPGGGGLTRWAIEKAWQERGVRILNEEPRLMVYESDPHPVFASTSAAGRLGYHANQLEALFAAAAELDEAPTTQEEVALALYNAAFFETSTEARFILRMMSLECLLTPPPRSEQAAVLIDELMAHVRHSALGKKERDSLGNALAGLKHESIGRTGRFFVHKTLGERRYADETAPRFFGRCYSLRSRLVHGDTDCFPTPADISDAAAGLELMLSDLLAGKLRDVPFPQPSV